MGQVLSLLLTSTFVIGCQAPVTVPLPAAPAMAASPELAVGQDCAVTLKSESPKESTTYEGRVKELFARGTNVSDGVRSVRMGSQMSDPKGRLTLTIRAGDNDLAVTRLPSTMFAHADE